MKDGATQSVSRHLAQAASKALLFTFLNYSGLPDGVRHIRNLQTFESRELIALTMNGKRVHVDAPDDIPFALGLAGYSEPGGDGVRPWDRAMRRLHRSRQRSGPPFSRRAPRGIAGRASVTTRPRSQMTQREVR